jgi:radical SAM superfamily enzyme YgiQ (UPF0313 family)
LYKTILGKTNAPIQAKHKEVDVNHRVSHDATEFLPVDMAGAKARGWDEVDFVYVSGDAYVDHPSFGMAIITRMLEREHYRVGIIAQPDWRDPASIAVFGKPRLGFFVSAGNMDSMVNHYTVAKKRRRSDLYSPGSTIGLRPDRATIVYSQLIRRTFKDSPIILGGIEASLRRLAHYDYWDDAMRASVLVDSGADLISYGMGEHSVVEIADALAAGLDITDLTFINGTVFKTKSLEHVYDYKMLPNWNKLASSDTRAAKRAYAESFAIQYTNSDAVRGERLVEQYAPALFVVQNPPAAPLTTPEMDAVYRLPYAYDAHPMYYDTSTVANIISRVDNTAPRTIDQDRPLRQKNCTEQLGIRALDEVKFSLASTRGCFGECSFCAITFHQGRVVSARSHESILTEARRLVKEPDFKGNIHDVGGPTANFRHAACDKQISHGACPNKRCLWPKPCKNLNTSHKDYVRLLRELREIPEVKHVFVRSGIRYDYALADKSGAFIDELVAHHVSGQLRVAPEHISDDVLKLMGKPPRKVYEQFVERFKESTERAGKEQYVLPYLMSSHPGSTLKNAVELAEFVRDMGYTPEQVQDFYPTPSTLSTAMFYTGLDPRTMQPVYVPRDPHEKAMQRALIQYKNPKNYALVHEALTKADRTDLIGEDKKCLIKSRPPKYAAPHAKRNTNDKKQRSDSKQKANHRRSRRR